VGDQRASFASFKYTYFENPNVGRPDYVADTNVNTAIGTPLDLANLDKIGLLTVPSPLTGEDAANAFFGPYIQKYGYISPTTGQKTGGGWSDTARCSTTTTSTATRADRLQPQPRIEGPARPPFRVSALQRLGGTAPQFQRVGFDHHPGGRSGAGFRPPQGGPQAYFIAAFQQQTTGAIPPIESTYKSQSLEANDTIRYNNWSFNLGVLISNDTLYGQGLEDGQSTPSGYVASPAPSTGCTRFRGRR